MASALAVRIFFGAAGGAEAAMKLARCPIVGHGKCAAPAATVRRLETALGARYRYRYEPNRTAEDLHWGTVVIEDLDFECMGKGITPLLCQASALAETAERLAVRDLTRLPGYTRAHQRDVVRPLRIEELLPHIATATPEVIGRIQATELAQHWADAESLLSGRTVKAPLAYLHGISGTNGLAAGNRLEEAIVQATLEVFERRAAITVLKQKLVMPTFNPATVRHPVLRRQMDALRALDVEFTLKDFSFGGAWPCVGVYFVNRRVPPELQYHHQLKVGAAFDREEALMRAFTEFAQGRRPHDMEGPLSGEYGLQCLGPDTDHFLTLFKFGFVSYPTAEFLQAGDVLPFEPCPAPPDCLDEIEQARAIFRRINADYIVADLTDPALGFPVVQVIVPGYSDILPYHPHTSQVLFRGWQREDTLGYA